MAFTVLEGYLKSSSRPWHVVPSVDAHYLCRTYPGQPVWVIPVMTRSDDSGRASVVGSWRARYADVLTKLGSK